MDVVPLETAYLFLLAAAEDVSTARTGEDTTDWSDADRAITCVRLNDGVLATAAADLGKGGPARFDNRPAMGGPAGTGVPTPEAFRDNVRLVRESTSRLVALGVTDHLPRCTARLTAARHP
jgi:hypothetical protein